MAIVAGIDEAGFGPVLGPLVVSAAAFEVPDELLGESLWRLLAEAVARKPAAKGGKIVLADSKKLYSRQKPNALAHLERGVLAVLAAGGQPVHTLGELLAAVAPAAVAACRRYPWYVGELALPVCVSAAELPLAGNALRAAMDRKGIRPAGLRAESVFEGEYNRHVAATNNKATVLFDVTSRLIDHLWRTSPPGEIRVYIDRQGGRMRYLPHLQRLFDGCQFKVLDETDEHSAYRVTGRDRSAEIHFNTEGEDAHLPIALGSMLSKYLRELFMELFNRYWASHVPGLAPTAGYYTDGRRFYEQIIPAMRRLGVSDEMLYRSR